MAQEHRLTANYYRTSMGKPKAFVWCSCGGLLSGYPPETFSSLWHAHLVDAGEILIEESNEREN